jgi:hypothetical protein
VLVPARFPRVQQEPDGLKVRHVLRFVGGVRDQQQDVQDRLGGQAWDSGGADVLDRHGAVIERGTDQRRLRGVLLWPRRVGLGQADRRIMPVAWADELGASRAVAHDLDPGMGRPTCVSVTAYAAEDPSGFVGGL